MPRVRLPLNSVRVRLALWNVGVLALVLIVLGVAFSLSTRANINATVDRRLNQQAQHMQQRFAGAPADVVAMMLSGRDPHSFHPHGGPPRPGDNGAFHPHDGASGPGDNGSFHPHDGLPPGANDDEALGEMRPRLFNTNGRPGIPGDKPWDRASFQRSLRGEEVYKNVTDGTDQVRVLSVPIRDDGRVVAVLQCGNTMTHLLAEEARTTRTLLTLIPLVLLVAGVGGAFLTERALRPVRRIAQEAGQIEAENLSRRLPVTGNDEFADLAETFNTMLARLQEAFERQEQAFEQQKRFAADASHELRTPLTIIKAHTSLALSGPRTAPELQKTLLTVDMAADRMTRIVQDLLLLARSDAGQLTFVLAPTSLAEVLSHALIGLQNPDSASINVSFFPDKLRVMANADALIRLFGNLLENALRYTPSEGRITVSADKLGPGVLVTVADTGEGIAPEHLPHLTERFYRVEAARSRPRGGTGLGLAICQSITEAHGGTLKVESAVGVGTTVSVTLLSAPETPADVVGKSALAAC